MANPVILFVNHRQKTCGVHQFGHRLFSPALKSQRYACYYIDIDNVDEFYYWRDYLDPKIVVYNYYNGATMPWMSPHVVNEQRQRFKQLCVFHEVNIWHMGFDALIHQDPTNTDTKFINISRPIPDYEPVHWHCDIPVIGSFGFGLGGKGFTRIVDYVKRDFDRAIIRFNIPFAAFGDNEGVGARNWAASCREHLGDAANIQLKITHDLLPENDLLDWLAMNTLNCFLYDTNHGRGISGTLDYALAANKPIAITRSEQFRHFWTLNESCNIENRNLRDIIAQGTENLAFFREKWGNKAVLSDWEAIFDRFS